MKKWIVWVGCILLFLPNVALGAPAKVQDVSVFVRGEQLYRDDENPNYAIKDQRVFLPVRKISETLGYQVDWNEKDKKITINQRKHVIVMTLGKKEYSMDGKKVKMDTAPFVQGERTYLPMRFLGEALGEKVEWDDGNRYALFGALPMRKGGKGERYSYPKKFTFVIPDEYKDLYSLKMSPNGFEFFEKSNQKPDSYNGYLGTLIVEERPGSHGQHIIAGKIGKAYIIFHFTSEVFIDQQNPRAVQNYGRAFEKMPEVLGTIEITNVK